MGTNYSPRIVTDGLIVCLDAKDIKSYAGSGTTWTDRSGNDTNGSINGATFNSNGYFDFDGTNDLVGPDTFDYDDSGGQFTVCVWLNPDTFTSSNTYLAIVNRTDNSNHIYSLFIDSSSGSGTDGEMASWFFDTGGTIRNHTSSANCVLSLNKWNFCVWRFADAVGYTYDVLNSDGSSNHTSSATQAIRKDSTSQFTIARWRDGSYFFNGKLSNINIYNKKLTDEEVKQNFNAQKRRFGI